VIVLGMISRMVPLGCPLCDKSLSDMLYAMAAYLALVLLFRVRQLGSSRLAGFCADLSTSFAEADLRTQSPTISCASDHQLYRYGHRSWQIHDSRCQDAEVVQS
jgi:hypothetical protein